MAAVGKERAQHLRGLRRAVLDRGNHARQGASIALSGAINQGLDFGGQKMLLVS
jgi:hypothetical protein